MNGTLILRDMIKPKNLYKNEQALDEIVFLLLFFVGFATCVCFVTSCFCHRMLDKFLLIIQHRAGLGIVCTKKRRRKKIKSQSALPLGD